MGGDFLGNKISIPPTLQLLIDTTEQLIMERGCRGTTIREIMSRSKVSMGGIYHYVKSKDELFGMILESKIKKIDNQFHQAVSKANLGELEGPLKAIVNGFFIHFTHENSVVHKIFIYLLSHQDDKEIGAVLTDFHNKWVEINQNWIEIGQKAGAIPASIDAYETSSMIVAFYLGLLIKDVLGIKKIEVASLYEFLSTILQNG